MTSALIAFILLLTILGRNLLGGAVPQESSAEGKPGAPQQSALQTLKDARFDLIFMDMRMPRLDGPGAARALRARGERTPIVALTANAFAEDRALCLDAGMNDHLTKPLEAEALRATLARWTNAANRAKVGAQ